MNGLVRFIEYSRKNNIKCYFFDFFDTVLHRKKHPENIKELWCEQLICCWNLSLKTDEMLAVRQESEEKVSHIKEIINCEYTYYQLCAEIYLRLVQLLNGFPADLETFYRWALQKEEILEMENHYADQAVKNMLASLHDAGKKTVVVSDFYLPEKSLQKFAENTGVSEYIDQYFVSCEYGCNKATGELYPAVLNKLGLSPSQCVMIGDNKTADCKNAKKYGIKAFYKKFYGYPEYMGKEYIRKELSVIAGTEHSFPYENYVFSLYLFIEKLFRKIVERKHTQILFLAREGEFLKKLFDYYVQNSKTDSLNIRTVYFCTSRIASYIPGLKALDEEDFSGLLNRYKDISINVFLKSLNFDDEEITAVKKSLSFDIDKPVENFRCSACFDALKRNDVFASVYDTKRIQQNKWLLQYLEQNEIRTDREIVLVDVGWRGTIQDNLFECFDRKTPVQGYYLGISRLSKIFPESRKEGLLFHEYPVKSRRYELWNFDKFMYERILYASHPSTIGYTQDDNGQITPVYQEGVKDQEAYAYIAPYQNRMFETFRKIFKLFSQTVCQADDFLDVFEKIHLEMLLSLIHI